MDSQGSGNLTYRKKGQARVDTVRIRCRLDKKLSTQNLIYLLGMLEI